MAPSGTVKASQQEGSFRLSKLQSTHMVFMSIRLYHLVLVDNLVLIVKILL